MKMIKILAALLILSTGSLVYAEYGMIPFSKEVSPDLDIGKYINFVFLGKLHEVGIKTKVFEEQPPINYQMAESPEVTIEPVGEDAVKQQLQTLSQTENLDGIIFGHIMQDLVKEMVYVIVRVYLVSEPEQYMTFGHQDVSGIKVADVKSEIINEHFAQISEDIKTWLRAKQPSSAATPQRSEPPTSEPSVPESEPDTSTPQQPSLTVETEPPVSKPTNAEQVDIVKNLGGSEDLMYLLGGEELSPKKSEQDVRIYSEVKTLKEIYTTLYEQKHRVDPMQGDEQILNKIAREKGISFDLLKRDIIGHNQRKVTVNQTSCWMRKFISEPRNIHGKVYTLCFEPSYLNKKSWRCPPTGEAKSTGKMLKRTHEQVKQELLDLNKRSHYKNWRMPTIDELFSMTNFLPQSRRNRDSLKFWSSTTETSSQGKIIWGLSKNTINVHYYLTHVVSLITTDSAFLIPVRDCQELHNR